METFVVSYKIGFSVKYILKCFMTWTYDVQFEFLIFSSLDKNNDPGVVAFKEHTLPCIFICH